MLNEIEASNLSTIEFKIVVIKMLKELSGNKKEQYESKMACNHTIGNLDRAINEDDHAT